MATRRRNRLLVAAGLVGLAVIGVGVVVGVNAATSGSHSITISGPDVAERPSGHVLISAKWGSGAGQFGYDKDEGGAPSKSPLEIAVSPDNKTIAVLDYANKRVQLFSRDGRFEKAIAVDGSSLADVAFDSMGRVLVLSYDDYTLRFAVTGAGKPEKLPLSPGLLPTELVVEGSNVFVRAKDGYFQVVGPNGVILAKNQAATKDAAMPAVNASLRAIKKTTSDATVWIRNNAKDAPTEIDLAFSAGLPIFEIWPFASDSAGNLYVMAWIYADNWHGTESRLVAGFSEDGKYLGQLRLPRDNWAGSGYTVAPDGKILEVRSTKAGVEVREHDLAKGA